MITIHVSGEHVFVFVDGKQVYEIEPEGESSVPPYYELGQQAVLDAAPVISMWAEYIKEYLQ